MQSLRLIALIALVVAISVPSPRLGRTGAAAGAAATQARDESRVAEASGSAVHRRPFRAIEASNLAEAIPLLEQVVARDQADADAYNWLAYATRRNGDPAKSIGIYQQALSLDPKHRGAHEYIGEAYLALNDLPNAKKHLATLNSLCFFPCEQYTDLKKAIQEYERNGGKTKPSAGR